MKRFFVGSLLVLAWLTLSWHAQAQGLDQALVVSACGTPPITYTPGQQQLPTVDVNGKLCLSGGGGGGSGTVTSVATGCQATGGTITTSGTISTDLVTVATITASQQDNADWCGALVIGNAATAQTLTLQNTVTSAYFRFINEGVGVWTIAPGVGSINSGPTSVAQNQSVDIQFDGTNWNIAGGVSGASLTASNTFTTASVASVPAELYAGAIFSGGSGATTTPAFLIQPSTATAGASWNTGGTAFGVNVHTGTGLLMDLQQDGVSRFNVSANSGSISMLGSITLNTATSNIVAGSSGVIGLGGRGVLSSPAVNVIQLGFSAAASPISQTLQSQGSRAGTDTNVSGGNLTITSGGGTGTGAVSAIALQSPVAVGSGTGAQTQTTGLTIKGGTAILSGYTVSTLPASPTTGAQAYVTDAVACTFLASVTGGGSAFCPVIWNGSAWQGG